MSNYDAFAVEFDHTRQRPWPEFAQLSTHISPSSRLLDVGCGNGRLRQYIPSTKLRSGNYFGLDNSTKLLDIARQQFPDDHFFNHDFTKPWPFGDDNFEIITAIASFHHILSTAEQARFLQEAFRTLKSGGFIFITTWILPRRYFWFNFWRGRIFTGNWLIPFGQDKKPRFYRQITAKKLHRYLKNAQFTDIQTQTSSTGNYLAWAHKS